MAIAFAGATSMSLVGMKKLNASLT